jgi:O-antigen/teichoic acid export membrane protein
MMVRQKKNIDRALTELPVIGRGAGFTGALKIAGYGLSMLASLAFARLAGAEVLGSVAVGISILTVCQVIANMGMQLGVLKFVSHFFGLRDIASAKRVLGYATGLSLALCATMILVYYMFAENTIPNFFFPETYGLKTILDCFLLILPFAVLTPLLAQTLTAFQKPQYSAFGDGIFKPGVRLGLFLVLSYWLSRFYALTVATAASYLLSACYMLFMLQWNRKKIERSFSNANNDHSLNTTNITITQFLSFSLPLALIPLLNLSIQQVDTLFVGHYLQAFQVGVYIIVRRLGDVVKMPILVFGGTVSATVSKLLSQGDIESIRAVYATATRWICVFTGMAALLIFLESDSLLRLFGESFTQGGAALKVMAIGQLVNSGLGPSGNILIMMNRQGLALFNSIFSSTLCVLLFLVLLPQYQIVGAAMAVAVTYAAVSLLSAFELAWFLRVFPGTLSAYARRMAALVLSGVACHFSTLPISEGAFLTRIAIGCITILLSMALLNFYFEGFNELDRAIMFKKARKSKDN